MKKYTPVLLGYEAHRPRNNEARFHADADGSFSIKIWEQEASNVEPSIKTSLALPGGVLLSVDSTQSRVFRVDGTSNMYEYYYVVKGGLFDLPVGTMELKVVINEDTNVRKFITIPPTSSSSGLYSEFIDSLLEDVCLEPATSSSGACTNPVYEARITVLENESGKVRLASSNW